MDSVDAHGKKRSGREIGRLEGGRWQPRLWIVDDKGGSKSIVHKDLRLPEFDPLK